MKLRTIIVEDEQLSRETLSAYLKKYCPEVDLIGMAKDVREGKALIETAKPDLVLLDVEMPYGNAFDLLESLSEINFETIFITAYSHYAMRALNFSASYYILKPIDIEELMNAVKKVHESKKNNESNVHTKTLVENIKTVSDQSKKVVLPTMEGFDVVEVQDIVRCQGNDNFTDFYLKDGTKKMICRTLKFYDEILKDFGFMRVHRSHMVNLNYITSYKRGKGGTLTMIDGSEVDVSPGKKQELLTLYQV
jgi:two-component system LytT family response regulator